MCDYIGDMLIRIKNGQNAKLSDVLLHNYTPQKCIPILNLLEKEGYINGWEEWSFKSESNFLKKKSIKSQIKVILKYNGEGKTAINGIFMISKPGRRIFLSTKALWKPKSGAGILILSTPFGIITDKEARLFNIGGEVLCGVY